VNIKTFIDVLAMVKCGSEIFIDVYNNTFIVSSFDTKQALFVVKEA
jgi:hypothetical protein